MRIEIIVPMVAPSLNGWYSSQHWSKRKKVADLWHEAIRYICLADKVKAFKSPVTITTQTTFPDNRSRDVSNYFTANKLAEDGLVKAGILINDTPEYVIDHTVMKPIFGAKKGETLIIISDE